MENINFRNPKLLLNNYKYNDDYIYRILNNEYESVDNEIPICRFRGTIIKILENKKLEIIGWQRNIARIRRMDVSLPTIVKILLNKDGVIENIELDTSFKGSKGLFCSQKYLNRVLKNQIKDLQFDKAFLKKIKVDNMYCFHIPEVLGGVYSYYTIVKDKIYLKENVGKIYFDEEISDSYIEDGNLIAVGKQQLKDADSINYSLILKNILNKIVFQKNGFLKIKENLEIEFYIDNKKLISEVIKPSSKEFSYMNLAKVLTKCLYEIKAKMTCDKKIKILNSNIFPAAYIGLLVQALSIRMYKNSYDYAMHMITSVQRPNNIPLCIGAITDEKDAAKYFPMFNMSEII